jgi:hypothetical protein
MQNWFFRILSSKDGDEHEKNRTGILAKISGNRAGDGLSPLPKTYGGTAGKSTPPHRRNIKEQKILLMNLNEVGYGNRKAERHCHTGKCKRREQQADRPSGEGRWACGSVCPWGKEGE